MQRYIFITGGVVSSLGKGLASAALGALLQARGYSVRLRKLDPYLNVDAGTMNPTEHGEVFVLRSGLETDQDMGNYERFLGRDLTNEDYMTSGMVYQSVIARERALEYGGKCVEAIPHVRDEILHRIEAAAAYNGSRVSVIEIGGTIGDFQNALFIEAARVLKMKYPDDVLFVMVSYLPTPGTLGEMKTKPTQMAVRDLNSYGVQPDFLVARSKEPIDEKRKEMRDSIAAQRVKTAQFYAKRRDFDAARIYYQLVTEKFGDTGSAEKAQKWLAANPAPESTAADKALRSTQKPS